MTGSAYGGSNGDDRRCMNCMLCASGLKPTSVCTSFSQALVLRKWAMGIETEQEAILPPDRSRHIYTLDQEQRC